MSYAPQDLLDLYFLARNVIWRQRLDDYEDKALGTLLTATDKARRETIREVERRAASETAYSDDRAMRLLRELEDLTLGVRAQLTDNIADIAAVAGEASFAEHRSILTVDGRSSVPFNDVSLSAGQLRQLLVETPVGGRLLREWVDGAFSERTQRAIQGDILAGVLKGEGYQGLSRRLEEGFNLARRDAITLARSYVQTANVSAQEATYQANGDVVKDLKWCATLENGYKASGRGTCLACAALDGKKWPINATHPPIPLHPRCRCVLLPVTVSWRDLGIDSDELEEVARPYTKRPDQNIDAGGRRTIIEVGQHQGDYASWFAKQGADFQEQALGPGRFDLVKSGRVGFGDLVDDSGRLRTLVSIHALRRRL